MRGFYVIRGSCSVWSWIEFRGLVGEEVFSLLFFIIVVSGFLFMFYSFLELVYSVDC